MDNDERNAAACGEPDGKPCRVPRCPWCGANTDADRAVLARIGGHLYRSRLADAGVAYRSNMADKDRWIREDAESLFTGRSYLVGHYSQPYRGSDPQWDSPAVYHGQNHVMSPRDTRNLVPLSVFDWPIYRAALVQGWDLGALRPALRRVLGDAKDAGVIGAGLLRDMLDG